MVDNMKSTQKNTHDKKYISLLASKAHSNFLKNNNFLKNYILKDNKYFITADFIQGLAEVPSVSKIITALARFLGDSKDSLKLIERLSLQAL